MKLRSKVIFIISYENWGAMRMSKHHYAMELAKAGNKVYFINHPDKRYELGRGNVKVSPTDTANVFEVKHRLLHPYFLKFKFKKLYNFLTRLHIRNILAKVGEAPDIVWSFDSSNTLPLKYFPKCEAKILMPVDGPFWHEDELRSADTADAIISVTDRILQPFEKIQVPKMVINHGVADVFLRNYTSYHPNVPLRIGYSGSLIRNDLDTQTFLTIIRSHPEIVFEFWGENDFRRSNMHLPQDVQQATLEFLEMLKALTNVRMHGSVSSAVLAEGIGNVDVLLICYNIKNDQNHHKVLEYLGTGRVIVSSYMSSYDGSQYDGLIEMVKSKENNDQFAALFDTVVNDLARYNADNLRQKRISYAKQHSYAQNISRIEQFLAGNN